MPLSSSLIQVGLAKEATQGVPVAASIWIPVESNIKDEDVIKWIEDKGLRGAPVEPIAQYQGPISSTVDFTAMFYPDTVPNLLMALMGSDAVTGTAAPYTHTITLSAIQPPSYTLTVYNGFNQRQYPGCMIDDLQLKWAMEGAMTAAAKWVGWPSDAVSGAPSSAFSSTNPLLGWQASLTIGGAVNGRLLGFDWTGKRKGDIQWAANNTQKPSFTYAGPLGVSGKLTFAIADDTELNYMLANTQPSVVLTLTAPNGGPTLKIQMSKCGFNKKAPSYTKDYIEVDYDIMAMPNTTDAGVGSPISPVQFVVTNSQSAAY